MRLVLRPAREPPPGALESLGVPVIGYGTDRLPAFYVADSGLKLSMSVHTPQAAAQVIDCTLALGEHAVVIANPVPRHAALSLACVEAWLARALEEARERGMQGKALTPFLLGRVAELSEGASLSANCELLLANAGLAAKIAVALVSLARH